MLLHAEFHYSTTGAPPAPVTYDPATNLICYNNRRPFNADHAAQEVRALFNLPPVEMDTKLPFYPGRHASGERY